MSVQEAQGRAKFVHLRISKRTENPWVDEMVRCGQNSREQGLSS